MHADSSRPAPDGADLPPLLRARVAPALTAWLDWLCPFLDDAMLAAIAAADYGWRADEYSIALRRICDDRRLPDAPAAVPLAVLELTRWSRPDDPAWQPGGQGRRGHLMRLFCCAALVALAGNPSLYPYFSDEEPTLLPLVESAVALGDEATAAMLPLLCGRAPTIAAFDDDRPFFAFGILLLAAARYREESDGPLLRELCRWTLGEEARACAAAPGPPYTYEAWLLGLKFSADGDDRWRALAWQLLIEPPTPHPASATAARRDIGARLVLGEPDAPSGAT